MGTLALAVVLAQAASPAAGGCYSQYFPVSMGSEWEYRGLIHSVSKDGQAWENHQTWTQKVVALSPESVKLRTAMTYVLLPMGRQDSSTSEVTYHCGPQGAVADATPAPADVTHHGSDVPRDLKPGSKWETRMDIVSNGTAVATIWRWEALAVEPVTVPAGQFDALKVAWEATTQYADPKMTRATKDMENVTTGMRWYAPQVGLVRESIESVIKLKGKVDSRTQSVDELVAFRP